MRSEVGGASHRRHAGTSGGGGGESRGAEGTPQERRDQVKQRRKSWVLRSEYEPH